MQSLHPQKDESLPEYFDARQKWPGMITEIQDQRDCGSSWAFSTSGKLPCPLDVCVGGCMHSRIHTLNNI